MTKRCHTVRTNLGF